MFCSEPVSKVIKGEDREGKDGACCLLVGVGTTCFLKGLKQPVKRFKSGGKQNCGLGGVTRFGQFVYLLSQAVQARALKE